METNKRVLAETSPDLFSDQTPKKPIYTKMADSFSWEIFDKKLNDALASQLENVVRKEDLAFISSEIQLLRSENARLQKELSDMKFRMEQVDKSSRRFNVVVRGLKSKFVAQAQDEFNQICLDKLKTNVNVVEARQIASGKAFLFTLNSALEVNNVMNCRRSLFGTHIFIDKDCTNEERNKQYLIRQIGKNVKKVDTKAKVRYGGTRIYVNDRPFTAGCNQIVASCSMDADFLSGLLEKANFVCEIIVKNQRYVQNPN